MRAPRLAAATITLALGFTVTGCDYTHFNSLPLPGNAVDESDSYQVVIEMANVKNLVGNSEVKVDDVTVGTVRAIKLDGWHAKVTVYLRDDVHLPANTTVKLAQKSLLGAEHLQLLPPPAGEAVGTLRDGDVIPSSRSGRYPETEEVLSAASMLLNGGGLAQIRTITSELNAALSGRENTARSLIGRLNTFVGGLNGQKDSIVGAIDSLDRLAGKLAAQKETLAKATDTIPPALAVLNEQRGHLTQMLQSLSTLGETADRVLTESREGLLDNLRSLQPTLTKLADAGKELPESLILAGTIPFPVTTAQNAFQGDYLNLFMTIDLTLPTIQKKLLKGMSLESLLGLKSAKDAKNPLLAPTQRGETAPPQAEAPDTPGPLPQPGSSQQQGDNGSPLDPLLGPLTGGGSR